MTAFLADLRATVDERTPLALDHLLTPFAHLGGSLDEFVAPARALLSGGKRLRAQLCGAGWLAAGGVEDPRHPALVHAGAALELFQACALVHDDVVDGAVTRRGMPAAHRALAAEHERRGRRGDADRFGVSGAILLGDLLLAAAGAELGRALAQVDDRAAQRARAVFDLMSVEVAIGQYLDVRAEHLPWGPTGAGGEAADDLDATAAAPDELATVLLVVRHKSARYSVEHPVALGAALAGAEDRAVEQLRAVGLPLGEAFQLRDDELGVFGEPQQTGKPAGDDLREGKRTALLALTLRALDDGAGAGPDAARRVRELVGRPDLSPEEVDDVRELMSASGAVAEHEELVATRRAAGLEALERAEVTARGREVLTDLAVMLTTRSA